MNVVLWFSVFIVHCVFAKINDDNQTGSWALSKWSTNNNFTSEEVYTSTSTKYPSEENSISPDEITLTNPSGSITTPTNIPVSDIWNDNFLSTRLRQSSDNYITNRKYPSEENDELILTDPSTSRMDTPESDNRSSKHFSSTKYYDSKDREESESVEDNIFLATTNKKYTNENAIHTDKITLTDASITKTDPLDTPNSADSLNDYSSSTRVMEAISGNYNSEVKKTENFIVTPKKFSTDMSTSATLNELITSSTDNVDTQSSGLMGSTAAIEDQSDIIPMVSCSELPEVNNLIVNADSFEITLSWEDPENIECVDEYIIYVDEEEYNTTPGDSRNFTIQNLIACNTYNIGIATSNETHTGPITDGSYNTTVPNPFNYTVANLNVSKVSENTLEITWQPPEDEIIQCITSYYVLWWGDDGTTVNQDIPVSNNSLELTPIIGCMNYTIEVYPKAGESLHGKEETQNYPAEALPTTAPQIVIGTVIGKDHINVTWRTDDKSKNKCQLKNIIVTCNAPTNQNSDAPWIVKDVEVPKDISGTTFDYRFFMTIDKLSPFTNYSCLGLVENSGGNSSTTPFNFTTNEDVPSAPREIRVTDVGPYVFTIQWTEPYKIPGIMTKYGISIENGGPMQFPNKECADNVTNHFDEVDAHFTSYVFDGAVPYHRYIVSVYGIDGAGEGNRGTTNTSTQSTEPDTVANVQMETPNYSKTENYHAVVTLKFDPPCNTNGPLQYYGISYTGKRNGFEDHQDFIRTNNTETNIELQPDREYSITIMVVAEQFNSTPVEVPSLHSHPGVPILNVNLTSPTPVETTKAKFTLRKEAFNDTNGEIVAYALLLLTKARGLNNTYGFWDGTNDTWPSIPTAQLLTPKFWNPFASGAATANFVIGDSESCNDKNYCNKKLDEDTEYMLIVRALTSAAYKDSFPLHFKTDMSSPLQLALILGLTFGLLALLILIIFLIFLWRRKRKATIHEEKRYSTSTPQPVPCEKFINYYVDVKVNFNLLKEQYTDLGTRSKDVSSPITYAILAENRRKNRYTNILPFDATRVKLKIDEDDEISSDYINASYIKGYSGKVEYIATQGPLESTARDFWKMILQENVSIIVMVSQFVEQSKEKCYQYFPNNHESAHFGELLEVKCSTELHFGTYCIRTLQVRKGVEQRQVIHMQFLEWPDFGVPSGTDNMLQFCHQLREKIDIEEGVMVVHCSAGVGRTGTLIALDILLQTINDHRDINIYKTVFDLRKQRTNMVQTEKQYVFLHTCVKDYLETPTIRSTESEQDRVYENVDVIKSSLKKNLIETELESAL